MFEPFVTFGELWRLGCRVYDVGSRVRGFGLVNSDEARIFVDACKRAASPLLNRAADTVKPLCELQRSRV